MDAATCSCFCTCQTGKCKAHLCLRQQRRYIQQCCCTCPRVTVPIADLNGRLQCNAGKCSFPWSNYLKEKWICPTNCTNSCGRKHIDSNTAQLPSFYSDDGLPPLNCGGEGTGGYGGQWNPTPKGAKGNKMKNVDEIINAVFREVKYLTPPIIWIFGHGHVPADKTRFLFCQQLAKATGFVHLNFDKEIVYWSDMFYRNSNNEELAILPLPIKRLASMCLQLMGDEELHLNTAGIMELVKLIMICWMTQPDVPKGFILENFPCDANEASMFESEFYPMSVGVYFSGRCWAAKLQGQEDCDLEVTFPKHFRRDTEYDESTVEALANQYGGRTIKVSNMEDFTEVEAYYIITKIKEKLNMPSEKEETPKQQQSENDGGGESTGLTQNQDQSPSRPQPQPQQEVPSSPCGNCNCDCCGYRGNRNNAGNKNNNASNIYISLGGDSGGSGGMGMGGGPLLVDCPLDPSLRPMKKKAKGKGQDIDWNATPTATVMQVTTDTDGEGDSNGNRSSRGSKAGSQGSEAGRRKKGSDGAGDGNKFGRGNKERGKRGERGDTTGTDTDNEGSGKDSDANKFFSGDEEDLSEDELLRRQREAEEAKALAKSKDGEGKKKKKDKKSKKKKGKSKGKKKNEKDESDPYTTPKLPPPRRRNTSDDDMYFT